jgi:hypothetical protein
MEDENAHGWDTLHPYKKHTLHIAFWVVLMAASTYDMTPAQFRDFARSIINMPSTDSRQVMIMPEGRGKAEIKDLKPVERVLGTLDIHRNLFTGKERGYTLRTDNEMLKGLAEKTGVRSNEEIQASKEKQRQR